MEGKIQVTSQIHHFLHPAAHAKRIIKVVSECPEVCISHRIMSKSTLWSATERKHSRQGVPYILFYTVLFHPVCVLIDNAVFASLLSPPHKLRATATVCVVVVAWISAMSRRFTSSHTIPVQFPYCFFPIVPVLNAEKIDIHWSIAKRSKYCPPQKVLCPHKKCWTSHCFHETKRLSLQVESLGL